MGTLIPHDRLAARHLVQRPVTANRAYRLEQVAGHPGRLRRVTESRKTCLPVLKLAGDGRSCDVTTAGRNGKNAGGAAERSLNGNTGVAYQSKPSLAVVS